MVSCFGDVEDLGGEVVVVLDVEAVVEFFDLVLPFA